MQRQKKRKNGRQTSLIVFIAIVAIGLSFFFTLHSTKVSTKTTTDHDCLVCHEDMKNSETLKDKARGTTKLIFFHSTHYKDMNISCLLCHDQDQYHSTRPKMETCLVCHDNRLASNDCSVCHSDPDKLEL